MVTRAIVAAPHWGAILSACVSFSALVSFCQGCAKSDAIPESKASPAKAETKVDVTIAALAKTKDREELARLTVALAESKDQGALDAVLKFLKDRGFLYRLDSEDDYKYLRLPLKIEAVLRTIARRPANEANAAMLALGKNPEFMSDHERIRWFMRACGEIREPSGELLRFLDSLAVAPTSYTVTIINTLADMRSPAACRYLERRFHSDVYKNYVKRWWFRSYLLAHRDDNVIVDFYERILKSDVKDSQLRNGIIEAIFDYKPREWYEETNRRSWYTPPRRRDATTEVLQKQLAIADYCEKLDITADTRQSIAKGRKEIETILEFRALGADGHAKLIRELGDNDFKVRDRAQRDLERFGDAAEPMLRDALKGDLPLETKQRIEKVLSKLMK